MPPSHLASPCLRRLCGARGVGLVFLLACASGDSAEDLDSKETGDTAGDSDTAETGDTAPPEGPERNLGNAGVTITGPSSSATGNAVAVADLTGDGIGDVAVAAYYIDRTCILWGPLAAGDHALTDAPTCLTGEASYDYSGYGLGAVGDLTGDGVADLIVGAIGNDEGGAFAGKAYLVPGGTTGDQSLGALSVAWVGEAAADYFGTQITGIGDATGDGLDDALVAAPGGNGGAGRVYLVPGGTTEGGAASGLRFTLTGETGAGSVLMHGETAAGDRLGDGVGGGDIDGDGVSDLAAGATGSDRSGTDAGALAVVYGPVGVGAFGFADADAILEGAGEGSYLGAPVHMHDDVDGDGRNDLLYAADGEAAGAGLVYIMTEPPSGTSPGADAPGSIAGEAASDEAGKAFAVVGDVDGDGAVDVAVGAPGNDTTDVDSGSAYLVRGPFGPGAWELSSADVRWRAAGSGDAAGRSVAGGADLDGDGDLDVAVGASFSDAGGSFSGRVFVVGW